MANPRFRFDDPGSPRAQGPRLSGRRFVAAGVVALLVLWGALYVAFRDWRARHRALAEFGRAAVAPAVEPLAGLRPPGVDPADWSRAVADTRAMLVALTASGLLDRPRMEALRDELRGRVARARDETAVETLRSLWDDMEARAGPVLTRKAERPPHPPPRPAILARRDAGRAESGARPPPR
jgi:hypothetical protein